MTPVLPTDNMYYISKSIDFFFSSPDKVCRYFNNRISNWMSQLQCKMGSIHINSLSLV